MTRSARDWRTPPRDYAFAPRGQCMWCREPISHPNGTPNMRRSWHPACVVEYRVSRFQGDARRALEERDKGQCAQCGSTPETRPGRWARGQTVYDYAPDGLHPYQRISWEPVGWVADHITPLWSVDNRKPDNFWAWTLANLQTLCGPCHAAKTAREAAERAAIRRANRVVASDLPLFAGAVTASEPWQEQDAVGSYAEAIAEIGRRVREGEPLPAEHDRLFRPQDEADKRP